MPLPIRPFPKAWCLLGQFPKKCLNIFSVGPLHICLRTTLKISVFFKHVCLQTPPLVIDAQQIGFLVDFSTSLEPDEWRPNDTAVDGGKKFWSKTNGRDPLPAP